MQYNSQKAAFSRCRNYRYSLSRSWSDGSDSALFIGLNPSTADHRQDDPTIRRCVGFAKSWGFAAMEIVNLFAFRSPSPDDLYKQDDPIGPTNNRWISSAIKRNHMTLACWGNNGAFLDRAGYILSRYPGLKALKLNASMQPTHPLYMKADMMPIPISMLEKEANKAHHGVI